MMKRKWDDAFRPTPEGFRAGMNRAFLTIEEGKDVKRAYKLSTMVIAAACAALLIGGIALAASVGVFDRFAEGTNDENQKQRFGLVNELAGGEIQTRTSADGALRMEMHECFFTGNELYAGYKLFGETGRLETALTPDADLIGRIKALEPIDTATLGSSILNDSALSAAVKALAGETFAGDAYGCVAYYQDYIGDHKFLLVNGEEYEVFAEEQSQETADGVTTGYFVLASEPGYEEYAMPDIDQSADDVSLVIKLQHRAWYYYKDASGFYRYSEADAEEISFSVQPAAEAMRTGSAAFEYDDYAVSVSIEASSVTTRAQIILRFSEGGTLTEQWDNEDQLRAAGKDALGYYTMVVDGVAYEGYEGEHTSLGEDVVKTQSYIFPGVPDDVTEITLRPRYILAGVDPDRDIVIRLEK